ncbi:hypothetical protein [Halodesulfovibrio marinisediminis]|uniref:Uncharacterized protein n=1 Tax=Halodesulfovibrio marinisediminis DSM 17456 TaxID=1121457 RepID=A0A1N6HHI5_9BACT|nr:hypothetical protein [Halodesulfovibrio marinisediminis]SIO19230.1 hypothetical protein SAMN02745161_2212 [Halodesulfovibrio marinisediminis DSM 17456]
MYINLIVGIIFIVLVVWIVKDFLKSLKSPARIMEDELSQRREKQEQVAANIERLRETGIKKLVPVRRAVEEMNAALPEGKQFVIENNRDNVVIVFEKAYVKITHRLTQFSLSGSEQDFDDDVVKHQRFVLERKDEHGDVVTSREADTEEEAIRLIAREIANVVEP